MKKIIKHEAVFNTNSTINNTGFIHSGVCCGGGGGCWDKANAAMLMLLGTRIFHMRKKRCKCNSKLHLCVT